MADGVDFWPQIITGAAGLVGSVIGATASVWGQTVARSREYREKKKSLAYSLAAEIQSYLEIVERRNRLRLAEDLVRRARAGESVPLGGWFAGSEKAAEFFPVFKGSVQNIGILGSEASQLLARFHREIEAVFTTMKMAEDGYFNSLSPSERADLIEGELEVWRGAVNTGKKLVLDLYAI